MSHKRMQCCEDISPKGLSYLHFGHHGYDCQIAPTKCDEHLGDEECEATPTDYGQQLISYPGSDQGVTLPADYLDFGFPPIELYAAPPPFQVHTIHHHGGHHWPFIPPAHSTPLPSALPMFGAVLVLLWAARKIFRFSQISC